MNFKLELKELKKREVFLQMKKFLKMKWIMKLKYGVDPPRKIHRSI